MSGACADRKLLYPQDALSLLLLVCVANDQLQRAQEVYKVRPGC